MTLPASFPLSMSQVATELGLTLPLSINHPWVIALGGVGATLPLSFSDLLGQSGNVNASGVVQQRTNSDFFVDLPTTAVFFSRSGGYISQLEESTLGNDLLVSSTAFPVPGYTGKIKVTNTTLGRSLILSYIGSSQWGGASGGGAGGIGIFGNAGATYNFTIYPST